jgi:hypothetical protein
MECGVSHPALFARFVRGALPAAVAAMAVVMTCLPAQASPAGPTPVVPGWRLFTGLSPAHASLELKTVAATSADDAWAVGSVFPDNGPRDSFRPGLWHWDGRSWRRIGIPARIADTLTGGPFTAVLQAVSATDVWIFDSNALGAYWIHLDGGSWSFGLFPGSSAISTAVAFGSRNVWALGGSSTGDPYIARYNGSVWTHSVIPTMGQWVFVAASGAGPADIWATTNGGSTSTSQVMRWNGRRWTRVKLPRSFSGNYNAGSVLAQAPRDVWLGGSLAFTGPGAGPVIAHWNGASWSQHQLGHASSQFFTLLRIVPDGNGGLDALASNNPGPAVIPLWSFWHLSGGRWHHSQPQPAGMTTIVNDLAHIPSTTSSWAVGGQFPQAGTDEQGMVLLGGPVPG